MGKKGQNGHDVQLFKLTATTRQYILIDDNEIHVDIVGNHNEVAAR
jgi:hypothetical protein